MKETGIIISGDHPKLILDDRKTQTRRTSGLNEINLEPHAWRLVSFNDGLATFNNHHAMTSSIIKCPYGQVGDRLWLKHRYDLFPVYYKPLEGWTSNYAAGTDGHIYRMDGAEPYLLKETPTGDYLAVSLSMGSSKHTCNVHRLICEAFYGFATSPNTQVRHIDGNSRNNLPPNLDWGTQEDNWADRKWHGRGMGEAHHNAKLTAKNVDMIRTSKSSQRTLARIHKVSQTTINDIKRNRIWIKAKEPVRNLPEWQGWKSPLFCPRWASRITLEITEVRVERVQEIDYFGARAEGILSFNREHPDPTNGGMGYNRGKADLPMRYDSTVAFMDLWDSLNAKRGYGWSVNPWVWVISFRRIK